VTVPFQSRVLVPLVRGQRGQPALQVDHGGPRVRPGQRCEALGGQVLGQREVLAQEALEAATSATVSEIAVAVISWPSSGTDTPYDVQREARGSASEDGTVTEQRTGGGDPAATLALLWRVGEDPPAPLAGARAVPSRSTAWSAPRPSSPTGTG
jgi:hypothetical protein